MMSVSVLISNNKDFQELLQLRERYVSLQKDLEKIEQKTSEEEQILIRPRSRIVYKISRSDELDQHQLYALMKQVIERHGGSCHIETLVEYIQKHWPRPRKSDGKYYTTQDYKDSALLVLKDKSNGFSKDSLSGWTLSPDVLEIDNSSEVVPLAEKIIQIIEEEENFTCNSQTIYAEIKSDWVIPCCRGESYTEDEVHEAVSITLETNPRFLYDSKNPENYSVIPSKKRLRTKQNTNPLKKRKRDECSSSDSEKDRPLEPPPGFKCSCGANTPGKTITAKWRIDSQGIFKCISCYGKNKRNNPKVPKKKSKKNAGYEPDSGPWIQCDKCHTWIPAMRDNIHDISLYDDSNPDHLDYFCPDCRAKQNVEQPQRKSTRRKSGNGRGSRVRE